MYGTQPGAASFDLGLSASDSLASQLREEEEKKRKRLAQTGIPAADPAMSASMSLGLMG